MSEETREVFQMMRDFQPADRSKWKSPPTHKREARNRPACGANVADHNLINRTRVEWSKVTCKACLASQKGSACGMDKMRKHEIREGFALNSKSYGHKSTEWILQFTADEMGCELGDVVEAIAEEGEIPLD